MSQLNLVNFLNAYAIHLVLYDYLQKPSISILLTKILGFKLICQFNQRCTFAASRYFRSVRCEGSDLSNLIMHVQIYLLYLIGLDITSSSKILQYVFQISGELTNVKYCRLLYKGHFPGSFRHNGHFSVQQTRHTFLAVTIL